MTIFAAFYYISWYSKNSVENIYLEQTVRGETKKALNKDLTVKIRFERFLFFSCVLIFVMTFAYHLGPSSAKDQKLKEAYSELFSASADTKS